MALRPMILGLGPRLKGNFVAIFEVIKALQFPCFFTLNVYSPHYWIISNLDFVIEFIGFAKFANLQKRKGIKFGKLFSNQISLVTLRSLFTISGQTKFLIPSPVYMLPCTFLFIIFTMDHPCTIQ